MRYRLHAPASRPLSDRPSPVSAVLAAAVIAALATPGVAQRQFEELAQRGLPADRDTTTSTALGDVDGDGDLDLVVGNSGQQNRLYLSNGTGTFADATATHMPVAIDNTTSLALGDVDGDGDLDLVVGNTGHPSGSQNRLYLNNGTGTFTDGTATRLPVASDFTTSLALGDVDGDGDLDLVAGNMLQQSRLHLNNGAGTFTDGTAFRMPVAFDATTSLALGDVDGDGDLDLVVGNDLQQNRLYLNDGTGTFADATASRMPVAFDRTQSLALGDVDGDGDLDLVVGNDGQDRLHLNNGSGTFADATATRMPIASDRTTSLALGDVDGDGDRDLVVGNTDFFIGTQNRLYLNNGTGTFTDATATRMPVAFDLTNALALGDVDGDGDLDLVVGNTDFTGSQNRLYLNSGTGTFTDATATRMPIANDRTTSLALGDVDGDGDLDLVVGNGYYQQSGLYLNNGTGAFTDATAGRMPIVNDQTFALVLGDVDGDGDLDLVVGNSRQQNRLYLNNGTGTFTDATAGRMPFANDTTFALALGDVDADGDLDLVVGNNYLQNRLYLNSGAGTFTDATATRMPVALEGTIALALGDVDGDGDPDLVVGNTGQYGGQNRLYLNNGTGTFTDATATRMPVAFDETSAQALGDVDADGDLDLVVGSYQQNRLYLNVLRQLDAPFVLHVGRTYHLDVYARYGPSRLVDVALPYFSTATANIPLPPLGTVGIDPNVMVALPAFVVPQPSGVGSLHVQVPNLPALGGIAIHTQALLIQYPVQDRLTNVNTDVVLR